jgi:hypothetical protein
MFYQYFEKMFRLINDKFQRIKKSFRFSYKKILYNIKMHDNEYYLQIKREGKILYAKRNVPNILLINYYVKLFNYLPLKLQYYLYK